MITSKCFLSIVLINCAFAQYPIIDLPNGQIQGQILLSTNYVQFFAYQEVPYAEPPIGELRFQPPVAKSNWDGVLKTQNNTKICYQLSVDSDMENEDCLYLNVYTPVAPGFNESLPVLFFIHGGGFVDGSGIYDTYGPERLMNYGIVLVTINYRLGPFGFLSTNDSVIPGNNGLRDQNLALKWVQSNIHLFGGDPTKVTLYGQSAGAASVCYHLLSKKSEGLFRATILSSGSCLSPWSYQRNAKDYAYLIASYISNITDFTPAVLKAFLTALPADLIDKAAGKIPETALSDQMVHGFFFTPVIEPEYEDAFITQKMFESFMVGNYTKVPAFIGVNSEEAVYRLINPSGFQTLIQTYEEDPQNLVSLDLNIQDEDTRKKAGEAIRRIYTDGRLQDDLSKAVSFLSDISFTKPVIKTAEIMANYSEVYFYQFSCQMKVFGMNIEIGVYHGEEMIFLWNYYIGLYNDENLLTSQRLLLLYTNFVKFLNPTPHVDPILDNQQTLELEPGYFPYIDVGRNISIKEAPKNASYPLWKEIYESYGVRPFDTY